MLHSCLQITRMTVVDRLLVSLFKAKDVHFGWLVSVSVGVGVGVGVD
jgi:hypothetical protein